MSQTGRVSASLSVTKTATPSGGQTRVEQALDMLAELGSGTTDGKADLAWFDLARVLASNTAEDLDVAGSLTDALGATVGAAEVIAFAIENPVTNSTNLTIGGASAELQAFFGAAGDKFTLKPGDFMLFYSRTGWAVAAGTADDLKIANASGASNTFKIGFIARSS